MNKASLLLERINDKIAGLCFGNTPANLYDPIYYIMKLGGKRIRPVLTLLSYEMFSQADPLEIIEPALALETFHNFTLMHDDVMDNAPLRRGKVTVHEKWNTNTAMLSGDVMLVRTYDFFLGVQQNQVTGIIGKFNDCAAQVCEGQQLDMDFETRDEVSEQEYLEMIKLKTAVLIGLSMELGSILGGATPEQAGLMKDFGINTGIGFQLKDDLLDAFPGTPGFGKQLGGDIISNKKTYLLIKALETAGEEAQRKLKYWLGLTEFNPVEKVDAVISIYNELNIQGKTKTMIQYYFNKGFESFDKLDLPEEPKIELRNYVESLVDRQK